MSTFDVNYVFHACDRHRTLGSAGTLPKSYRCGVGNFEGIRAGATAAMPPNLRGE